MDQKRIDTVGIDPFDSMLKVPPFLDLILRNLPTFPSAS